MRSFKLESNIASIFSMNMNLFPFHEKSSITSEERMRQLEQLEKRSQKSSAQQIQVVERFSKSSHTYLVMK